MIDDAIDEMLFGLILIELFAFSKSSLNRASEDMTGSPQYNASTIALQQPSLSVGRQKISLALR